MVRDTISLTIVGLGPGSASLLTVEARELLASADEVWLRTRRHPAVSALPDRPRYESFDPVYDASESFDDVYASIVARVMDLAGRPEGVIYAVPGHPLFGEATVRELLRRVDEAHYDVRIVAGLSFLDSVTSVLHIDPLDDGMLLLDALALGAHRRLLAPQRPTVIAQVYDHRTAVHTKLALLEAYPPDHPVRIVRAAGARDSHVVATTIARLDRDHDFGHLASIYVPPVPLPEDVRSFEGVRAIVAKLRDPDGGCPWDLEQTHDTLKRFLLEEAYEALEALDEGEPKRLADELGDLLMQIVLHAQLAEDTGAFAIEDVLGSIGAKLVRRHPHVFGDVQVEGAQEVLRNWETLKKDERGDAPLLDAVPRALPALAQAQSLQSRAAKAGLDAVAPSTQALAAALSALGGATDDVSARQLGDLLFGVVALARSHDLDAEESLRMAIRAYRDEIAASEKRSAARGQV